MEVEAVRSFVLADVEDLWRRSRCFRGIQDGLAHGWLRDLEISDISLGNDGAAILASLITSKVGECGRALGIPERCRQVSAQHKCATVTCCIVSQAPRSACLLLQDHFGVRSYLYMLGDRLPMPPRHVGAQPEQDRGAWLPGAGKRAGPPPRASLALSPRQSDRRAGGTHHAVFRGPVAVTCERRQLCTPTDCALGRHTSAHLVDRAGLCCGLLSAHAEG